MTEPTEHDLGPTTYQLAILQALQPRPFYQGTVDPAVKAERRAKNKVARASRKVNRQRG